MQAQGTVQVVACNSEEFEVFLVGQAGTRLALPYSCPYVPLGAAAGASEILPGNRLQVVLADLRPA